MNPRILMTALTALALGACHIEHKSPDHEAGDEPCDTHAPPGSTGSAGSAGSAGADADAGSDAEPELGCLDMTAEEDCAAFGECEPIYAGIDCSCGPDCACIGGEPGCVCESFEFFQCVDAL